MNSNLFLHLRITKRRYSRHHLQLSATLVCTNTALSLNYDNWPSWFEVILLKRKLECEWIKLNCKRSITQSTMTPNINDWAKKSALFHHIDPTELTQLPRKVGTVVPTKSQWWDEGTLLCHRSYIRIPHYMGHTNKGFSDRLQHFAIQGVSLFRYEWRTLTMERSLRRGPPWDEFTPGPHSPEI